MELRKPPSCQFTQLWMQKQNGAFQFCCLLPGVRDRLPWIFWIPAANGREFCSLASWGPARVKHEMEAGGCGSGGWKPEVKGSTSSRVKADCISSHIHLTICIFLEKNRPFCPLPYCTKRISVSLKWLQAHHRAVHAIIRCSGIGLRRVFYNVSFGGKKKIQFGSEIWPFKNKYAQ